MLNKYFSIDPFSGCPVIIIIISVFMQVSCRENRQSSRGAHSIYPVNEGHWVFAADMGIDKVLIYKIDSGGNLNPGYATPSAVMEPGAELEVCRPVCIKFFSR